MGAGQIAIHFTLKETGRLFFRQLIKGPILSDKIRPFISGQKIRPLISGHPNRALN